MQFNFNCYALVELDIIEDDYEDGRGKRKNFEGSTILGFYLTEDEAITARITREVLANVEHDVEHDDWRRKNHMRPSERTPGEYAIIPLREMKFKELDDADEMIQAAAKLTWSGVGVTA